MRNISLPLFSLFVWMSLGTLNSLAGFSSMYVFGDSLSAVTGSAADVLKPPGASATNYWNGRFSNGQVWVEYLAALQGIPFDTNHVFAHFGNDAQLVHDNIVSRFSGYTPPPDISTSLYIFWSGCSDCFLPAFEEAMQVSEGTNVDAYSWTASISNEMVAISASVDVLYSQGVRTLLLPNAVDVSTIPYFTFALTNITNYYSLLASVHAGVQQYNAALAVTLNQLRAEYPALTLYSPDFYADFNFALANAAIYGLTKTNVDALEDPALTNKSFTGPGANYVFWDWLHPTTKLHAAVAGSVEGIFLPMRIKQLTIAGGSNRFDLVNLPVGLTGKLESTTNLANPGGWTNRASIVATGATQSVFISTNGLGNRCFFRLSFPP